MHGISEASPTTNELIVSPSTCTPRAKVTFANPFDGGNGGESSEIVTVRWKTSMASPYLAHEMNPDFIRNTSSYISSLPFPGQTLIALLVVRLSQLEQIIGTRRLKDVNDLDFLQFMWCSSVLHKISTPYYYRAPRTIPQKYSSSDE
jgi:hypothetical protein